MPPRVFTDEIRRMADPQADPLMVTSQGIHLVFDRSFLKGDTALMVPRTSDGRVLFVIPWHGHAVAGTTDTPIEAASLEPKPLDEEIQFILETAGRYLTRPPSRTDVLSVYVGLRPLCKSRAMPRALPPFRAITSFTRRHPRACLRSPGAKWTTYRHMAEDTVDHAITLGRLRDEACTTKNLKIHGYAEPASSSEDRDPLEVYGSDAEEVRKLAQDTELAKQLHPALPYIGAEVVWAARAEMARTVEDVLARHTRALFLDARAAMQMARPVARLMAAELGRDDTWAAAQTQEFCALAKQYTV